MKDKWTNKGKDQHKYEDRSICRPHPVHRMEGRKKREKDGVIDGQTEE